MTQLVLLTATEVGAKVGCSARTIIRRAEDGELAFVRKLPGPNGDYLFELTEVERYIESLKASA